MGKEKRDLTNLFQSFLIQEIKVDIRVKYLWHDDRLNFTGKGEVEIPAYNYKKARHAKRVI